MVLVFTYTTSPHPIYISKGVKEEISGQKDDRSKGPDREMSWLYQGLMNIAVWLESG